MALPGSRSLLEEAILDRLPIPSSVKVLAASGTPVPWVSSLDSWSKYVVGTIRLSMADTDRRAITFAQASWEVSVARSAVDSATGQICLANGNQRHG
jgi:hypothetical protein